VYCGVLCCSCPSRVRLLHTSPLLLWRLRCCTALDICSPIDALGALLLLPCRPEEPQHPADAVRARRKEAELEWEQWKLGSAAAHAQRCSTSAAGQQPARPHIVYPIFCLCRDGTAKIADVGMAKIMNQVCSEKQYGGAKPGAPCPAAAIAWLARSRDHEPGPDHRAPPSLSIPGALLSNNYFGRTT